MDRTLLFLIKLAWESRYRLPLLITIGAMILDVRVQLEIHVHVRRIRRQRTPPARPRALPSGSLSDDSNDSWVTFDDDETIQTDTTTENESGYPTIASGSAVENDVKDEISFSTANSNIVNSEAK